MQKGFTAAAQSRYKGLHSETMVRIRRMNDRIALLSITGENFRIIQ